MENAPKARAVAQAEAVAPVQAQERAQEPGRPVDVKPEPAVDTEPVLEQGLGYAKPAQAQLELDCSQRRVPWFQKRIPFLTSA